MYDFMYSIRWGKNVTEIFLSSPTMCIVLACVVRELKVIHYFKTILNINYIYARWRPKGVVLNDVNYIISSCACIELI